MGTLVSHLSLFLYGRRAWTKLQFSIDEEIIRSVAVTRKLPAVTNRCGKQRGIACYEQLNN